MHIKSAGHAVFAVVMACIGIIGFVNGDFTAIWNGVPKTMPGREILAYACALVCIGCGVGLFLKRVAVFAAGTLLAWLLLWMLIFKSRYIILAPLTEISYQTNGQNAVYIAGAWVLWAWFAADREWRRLGFTCGDSGIRIARVFFGLALVAFGFSHFAYLDLTAPLVPAWLPWHTGWAYFTGGAYLAAGAAVLSGVYARLAASLATLQMGLFLALVWVPRMVTGHITTFQWGESEATCALTAGAWVVADSWRGTSWFDTGPILTRLFGRAASR